MSHPLVTIGIPTYNRADGFLKDSIRSVLNQTYQNIEIIVADNCSIDHTEEVVKSFQDSRIKYFRQKVNIGANNNFNFCVNKAKGSYFLLLHDDDMVDTDFIDVCMKAVNYNTTVGIVRTGTRIIDSDGKVKSKHYNRAEGDSTIDFFRSWFFKKASLYLCSTLFNTKHLQSIGGFLSKKNLFQDVVAEVQLVAKYGRKEVRDIKASFRRHHGEITFSVKVGDWCEDSLMLLDVMCDLAPEYQSEIKRDGARFLSELNYSRAQKVDSRLKRNISYLKVFKSFNYRYLPPNITGRLQSIKRRLIK